MECVGDHRSFVDCRFWSFEFVSDVGFSASNLFKIVHSSLVISSFVIPITSTTQLSPLPRHLVARTAALCV